MVRASDPRRGSVMIEFAIGLIVFLMLVGIIVDLGVGIFHFNTVKKALLTSTRQVTQDYAVRLVPQQCVTGETPVAALVGLEDFEDLSCPVLRESLARCAEVMATSHLTDANANLVSRTTISSEFNVYVPRGADAPDAGDPSYYMLTTSATFDALCGFCGLLPKLGFSLGNNVMMQNKLACS